MRNCTIIAALTLIAASLVGQTAFAAPQSGMLLGVHAFPNWRGLRIVSTIPGYSAHGRMHVNDVLLRASDGTRVYDIRTHWGIEQAKDRIGPNRTAAIEFFRPGLGVMYMWVEFRPVGGSVQLRTTRTFAAQMQTEAERPGARALFQQAQDELPAQPAPGAGEEVAPGQGGPGLGQPDGQPGGQPDASVPGRPQGDAPGEANPDSPTGLPADFFNNAATP